MIAVETGLVVDVRWIVELLATAASIAVIALLLLRMAARIVRVLPLMVPLLRLRALAL